MGKHVLALQEPDDALDMIWSLVQSMRDDGWQVRVVNGVERDADSTAEHEMDLDIETARAKFNITINSALMERTK